MNPTPTDVPSDPSAHPGGFGLAVDLSSRAQQQLIGYLGFLLPLLLYAVAGLRPTDGLQRWKPLDSVSAYYYSGASAIFVGVLFGLALFLLTYPGYSDARADRVLGRLAALFAFGTALFPTAAPEPALRPTWWTDSAGSIHLASAALLFGCFALFSIWLFRRTDVPKDQPLPAEKRFRNALSLVCGLVIVASILSAGIALASGHRVFWPEATALWAFAISWLVKGRAHTTLAAAARRMTAAVRRSGE